MAQRSPFTTPPLLEIILHNLPARDIVRSRRVNQNFQDTIAGSLVLQRDINPGQATAPPWTVGLNINVNYPPINIPKGTSTDINPVLIHERPENDDDAKDDCKDDMEQEGDDKHNLNTRSWSAMASFTLDTYPSATPPYVEFCRRVTDFRSPLRDTIPSYNEMFVTVDPQVPVKITVENDDALQVGFDWDTVSISIGGGATLGQLLDLSQLIANLAAERQDAIDNNEEAYHVMITEYGDSVLPEMHWRGRLRSENLLHLIRRRDGDPAQPRVGPTIIWQGVSDVVA